jgi:hypothetical protein
MNGAPVARRRLYIAHPTQMKMTTSLLSSGACGTPPGVGLFDDCMAARVLTFGRVRLDFVVPVLVRRELAGESPGGLALVRE